MRENHGHMSYESLKYMRKVNPSWRLLASTNAPFAIAFLYKEFLLQNQREIAEEDLIARLDSFLEDARNDTSEDLSEKISAKDYLNRWASDNYNWLRRFYPPEKDMPHYDLTSSAQRGIEWLVGLNQQSFVGTESRLRIVFDILQQIVEQTDVDPASRIDELNRKKAEIDQEIDKIMWGHVSVLDDVQVKERFYHAMSTAREILADFRLVEQNFRELDREFRKKIIIWNQGKGGLLKEFFHAHDEISQSEQGKSFAAFLEFLLSKSDQDAYEEMIDAIINLEAIKDIPDRKQALRLVQEWIEGSKHVQDTMTILSGQLRRYVDENYLVEERRINELINLVFTKAVAVSQSLPNGDFMEMDALKPSILLPMERPLFTPPFQAKIIDDNIEYGASSGQEDALYSQIYIDRDKLLNNVISVLKNKPTALLSDIISAFPLENGLNELINYFVVASKHAGVSFDYEKAETIEWKDENGATHNAQIPLIIFKRTSDMQIDEDSNFYKEGWH